MKSYTDCNCCACRYCCMCPNCHTCCTLEQAILDVCQSDYEFFLSKANVVGLGLGYKTVHGYTTRQKCIKVYVSKKHALKDLYPLDVIPYNYNGMKTDVVNIGRVNAISLVNELKPFPGSYSIGPLKTCICGSYGCLVKDNKNNFYILGSNLMFPNGKNIPLGTPIVEPLGKTDESKLSIAKLSKAISIKFMDPCNNASNYVNCSMAKILNPDFVSPKINILDIPKGLCMPKLGEVVTKLSKTTDLTKGKINSIGTTIIIDFPIGKSALFKNQIITTPMDLKDDEGDALLINKCNQIIGLGCGNSSGATVFNTMVDVLTYLNVDLVTKI